MSDAEARRRIALDLDRSFVVEAAAGTGKTTALIGRMIAILRAGRASLAEIVALTFTEKAAGEMKLRLRTELEHALGSADDDAERKRFTDALGELEAARLGTIHSFCRDLLGERPVEAGIDPDAEIVDEDSSELVARAFAPFFEARLEAPPTGIGRLLRRRGSPRTELLRAAQQIVDHRDHDAPYAFPPGFDRDGVIDELLDALRSLAALARLARDPTDYLLGSLRKIELFVEQTDARERVRARDYDGLEAELRALRRGREWHQRGRGHWYGEGLTRTDVISRRDRVVEAIDGFLAIADADLAAHLRLDLWPVVDDYARLKVRAGRLDFLDLLIETRNLIRDDAKVRAELRAQIRCIFVDEFQDTDPLQAEILTMLATDEDVPPEGMLSDRAPPPKAGKLFVVGDPKQAIYGFRRADVMLYDRLKRRWMKQGVELLTLSTSFRARLAIQQAINTGFSPLMRGARDGSQATYVRLDPYRPAAAGRPSVIALPVPRPYGTYGKIWNKAIEESTPDAVAAFVEWLLRSSGWTLEDAETGEPRAFESRDVCLLFRNTTSYGDNVVAPYALALEARSIPHVLAGGRAFRDREEVLAFATVIRAIEHPGDALRVYAALRGPFFGLRDDVLLAHRERAGTLHPLAPLGDALFDEARRPVAEALDILRELHVHRSRRPIADTLARFLDATRAHAGLAFWENGEQALANVLRVLDLARRFEAAGASSFRAFVERLEERIEHGEGVDAPVVEERAAGVRVMTVHKAKGLEFPVVILCDPTLSRRKKRPTAYADAERRLRAAPLAGCAPLELTENREAVIGAEEAEEVRIAYVAATRAREILVVPCVGDGPEEGWVDPLHRALYPSERDKRVSAPAPGCPEFGGDSVLDRPPDVGGEERSVKPGLHRIEGGEVVFWDPRALPLGRVARGGLRRTALLAPDEGGGRERVNAYYAWVDARAVARDKGAAPSWSARSVTAAAHATESTSHTVTIEQTGAPREGRASGKRFGSLVHAVLAECALDADAAALRAMATYQGRLLDAPPEEIEAAAAAAAAALAHHRLVAARASAEVRRECPITVPLQDGSIAEGVIDLVYRTDAGWVVVDYKTDRERGEKMPHAVQLSIYARAVAAATGEPAVTVLLYV